MRPGWFGPIGFVAMLIASGAHAEDRLVGGVPLPDNVEVQTAPPDVSGPAGAFSGAWIGSWDGAMRHVLVVEAVQPGGTAQVLYAVADAPEHRIRRAWLRRRATMAGGTLTLEGPPAASYTLEPSGSLRATYRRGAVRAYARMSRVPLADLTGPAADLDWSEPVRAFVDGPVENGWPVRLEVVLFRPRGGGPFPLFVVNHGSTGCGPTGCGTDPALFARTAWNFGLADAFVSRGWMVVFPQRRGRGRSGGVYDEGFGPDRRAGYTCDAAVSLRGAERALADIEAAVTALRRRADVAGGPILIGGISRGGVLSIAFAGRHPGLVGGVVNFVGGWLGTDCGTAAEVNGTLFRQGGRFHGPTLWLYGNGDAYYPIEHSRANFDLFRDAGGLGRFLVLDVPHGNGHAVANDRELWLDPVEAYLASIGPTPPP